MYGIARGELHRILDISRLKYKKKILLQNKQKGKLNKKMNN